MDTTRIPPATRHIWAQTSIPIIVRPGRDPLTVRLPYAIGNRAWLCRLAPGAQKPKIEFDGAIKAWKVPASWLNRLVEGALHRYGSVRVVQPYRALEKCAPACRSAQGHACSCSCMGVHQGTGDGDDWFEVCEAFSFLWGDEEVAIRLMVARDEALV